MKILFSPSEAKDSSSLFDGKIEENLCLKELNSARAEVLEKYNYILKNGTFEEKSALLGLKKQADIDAYKAFDGETPLQSALLRYSGVGYKYLDYPNLDEDAKKNAQENIFIFSNLLGIVQGKDCIPYYKVKQGSLIGEIDSAKHYKKHLAISMEKILKDELIIDLRAGYYEKYYTPKTPYIALKFLKNGKAVSHFAKAYRGIVARALCIYNPQNEEEFKALHIPDLFIKEIQIKGKKTTYIYDIAN